MVRVCQVWSVEMYVMYLSEKVINWEQPLALTDVYNKPERVEFD